MPRPVRNFANHRARRGHLISPITAGDTWATEDAARKAVAPSFRPFPAFDGLTQDCVCFTLLFGKEPKP